MTPYFLLLALPAMFSADPWRRGRLPILLVFLVYVVFTGLRYNVGMDWNNYEHIHNYISYSSPAEIMRRSEPLSYLLFWFSKELTGGTPLTNLVAGAILVVGVFLFASRTHDPWLSIVSATPFLVIAVGMSGVRQAMAMGIVLVALSVWDRASIVTRTLLLILTGGFHLSALSMMLLLPIGLRVHIGIRLVGAGTAIALAAFVLTRTDFGSDRLPFYVESYVSGESVVQSPGALLHLLLLVIPIVLCALRWRYFFLASANVPLPSPRPEIPHQATVRQRVGPLLRLAPLLRRGMRLSHGLATLPSTSVGTPNSLRVAAHIPPGRQAPVHLRIGDASKHTSRMNSPLFIPEITIIGILLVGVLLISLTISSVGASRMSIYLQYLPMLLYPAFVHSFNPKHQPAIRLSVIMLHFAILGAWLLFANNSSAHIPYRNVLFEAL